MISTMTEYPASAPKEHGYYVTKYFNTEMEDFLYKAFWWNGIEFGGWRLPIDKHVVGFFTETHDLHYVPSMMKANI